MDKKLLIGAMLIIVLTSLLLFWGYRDYQRQQQIKMQRISAGENPITSPAQSEQRR